MEKSSFESTGFTNLIQQQFDALNSYISTPQPKSPAKSSKMMLCAEPVSAEDYQKEILLLKIELLKTEARHMINLAQLQTDEYSALKSDLLDKESLIYSKVDEGNAMNQKLQSELEELEIRLKEYERANAEITQEINTLQKQINEANKKRERANTWYYMLIPGYNLYLLCDALINANIEQLNVLKSRLQMHEKAREELLQEIQEKRNKFIHNDSDQKTYAKALIELKQSLVNTLDKITQSSNDLVTWNNLYVSYGKMEQDIQIQGLRSKYALKPIEF